MDKGTQIRNGMIVFDEPMDFGDGGIVYGILFNKDTEKINEETGNSISEYVEYLAGMAQVCKYGVPLEDDKGWSFRKKKINVNCDTHSLASFVGIFFKDKVGFKIYTFDEPLVWQSGEVDEDDNNIIVCPDLIKRYSSCKNSNICKLTDRDKVYDKNSFNSIAVFDRPLKIEGVDIYGLMFNSEQDKTISSAGDLHVDEYITILAATEQWLLNGGEITDDGSLWIHPDGIHSFETDKSFYRIVLPLMKGTVGYKKYEFENPILWEDDETLDYEPRCIINRSLIERYVDTK